MENKSLEKIETYKLNEAIEEDYNLIESDILDILSVIESNFIDKKIIYFYKQTIQSSDKKLSVAFFAENIMHLLGIAAYAETKPIWTGENKTPSYAKDFYTDFKANSLEFDKCWVESASKVKDKLKVLKYLPELITENVRIGESGAHINLSFSNIIRTNKNILGIAVIKTETNISVPISALNLSEDKRATQHTALSKVVPCSRIEIHKKLENGSWQHEKTFKFDLKRRKRKKKKRKKITK